MIGGSLYLIDMSGIVCVALVVCSCGRWSPGGSGTGIQPDSRGESESDADTDTDSDADTDTDSDADTGTYPDTSGWPESLADADAKLLAGGQGAAFLDLNGDEFDDLVIGEQAFPDGASSVYLLHGPVTAFESEEDAVARLVMPGGAYSWVDAVDRVGDMNGDGLDEILVGNGRYPWGLEGTYGGAWLVYPPVTGSMDIFDAAEAAFLANEDAGGVAQDVSRAGDVDGDGYEDLLIAAVWDGIGEGAGSAMLIRGPVEAGEWAFEDVATRFTVESELDTSYPAIAGDGDVNGDGLADFLFGLDRADSGTGSQSGMVWLVLGPADGPCPLSEAGSTIVGNMERDSFGEDVAIVGDLDRDGLDDYAVVAGTESCDGFEDGAVYFFTETYSEEVTSTVAWGKYCGGSQLYTVAAAGDVNADGRVDVVVGDPFASVDGVNYVGESWVLLAVEAGVHSLSYNSTVVNIAGEVDHGYVGIHVAGDGDTNADGFDDVLIAGTPGWCGWNYLVHGR